MKTNKILTIIFLIVLVFVSILISGCNLTGKALDIDVTPIANALPQVQQFLKEHPSAEMKMSLLNSEYISENIDEIREYCEGLPVASYYKIIYKEQYIDLVVYLNRNTQEAVCIYQKAREEFVPGVITEPETPQTESEIEEPEPEEPEPYCGDSNCDLDETCSSCPEDCGKCEPTYYCGDGICNGNEDCKTCESDCGVCLPVCGDGVCEEGEEETCLDDCTIDCVYEIERNVEYDGEQILVTYTLTNYPTEGKWASLLKDQILGGCTAQGGRDIIKTFFLSVDGIFSRTINVTPSESGECSFHGDYNFVVKEGVCKIIEFEDASVEF